ncbi:RNA recognition motif (RRM, RBD, or RNP domain) [Novymonas esmeraldas]|uniref:RNA recognition motif (RRM, RBD, or RNP domain) n=1 Tax=Novymonas esmeraldas TaxID=1808958 RepID=A0AAW0F5V2_9TRYP
MEGAAAPSTGLQQLRRVRRARTQYERLQRPDDIQPGSPIPSIEGWVLFFSNLPETTTQEDIANYLVSFKEGDPEYFSSITDIKIPLNADCFCAGYALVELGNRVGYDRAIAELNGTMFPAGESPLIVAPTFLGEEEDAEPQEEETAPGDKRSRDDEPNAASDQPAPHQPVPTTP